MTNQALAVATDATTQNITQNIYESLALRGDLSGLKPEEKAAYYSQLCQRLGIDPATKPFEVIKLSGKETMYATKGATDQLARLHNINRRIADEKEVRGVYIVTVEASLPNGRSEQDKGAVTIENLKGDAFCNAIMKAITKAKRRATLAILGLGLLDETELETIPREKIEYVKTPTKGQLTQTAQSEPSADAPNHSVDEQAMREQIHAALSASGVNPANALKKFDSLATTEEKANAVRNTLKFAIVEGIVRQNWDADETDVFLSGFGIESGLESATLAQLETVYGDMRADKMI